MTTFLGIVAAAAVFFIGVMIADCNRFVIREYTVTSDKLKKGGRFILLSDLHNKSFGKENRRLLLEIEKQKPDAILIAGDMYTSAPREDNMASADFVCRLAGKYPVYYGNGNHEQKTRLNPEIFGNRYEAYAEKLKEAGVNILVNEKVTLPSYNMDIYGLEIDRAYYKKFTGCHMERSYLEGLLRNPHRDSFNLLIAHNPDYFETYAEWGADLTVSGHIHGGLMVLPFLGGVISPRLCLFPHYDGGEFTCAGKKMVLSRGLGTHTLPIRIFNPGELVVIDFKEKSC